jgi:hypothetical protein
MHKYTNIFRVSVIMILVVLQNETEVVPVQVLAVEDEVYDDDASLKGRYPIAYEWECFIDTMYHVYYLISFITVPFSPSRERNVLVNYNPFVRRSISFFIMT